MTKKTILILQHSAMFYEPLNCLAQWNVCYSQSAKTNGRMLRELSASRLDENASKNCDLNDLIRATLLDDITECFYIDVSN